MYQCYILPVDALDLLRIITEERYSDTSVEPHQLLNTANRLLTDFFTPEESDIEDSIFDAISILYEQSIQHLSRITNLNHCYMEYVIVDKHGIVIVTISRMNHAYHHYVR